jgi:DNA-directed RNA polymerase subunit N (RpoN/RPB10)
MIFPIRCVSCNSVIAGKWLAYVEKVKEYRRGTGKTDMEYLTSVTTKTAEGRAMDDLGITKQCCRRHFLTHVDLI